VTPYNITNLKDKIVVDNVERPYLKRIGTHDTSYTLLEKGAAIDASDSASEIPASAALRA